MHRNKIFKLKQWFSLADAADKLTSYLLEPVVETDLIELALDGHINLHWYLRHIPAVEVEHTIKEIDPFLAERKDSVDHQSPKPKKYYKLEGYFPVEPNEFVINLYGPHRLLFEECGALKDYLQSKITNTGENLISIDGFWVEDSCGAIWNIRERFSANHLKHIQDSEIQNMSDFYSTRNYFPSNEWPELSELGFPRIELEKLEAKLLGTEKSDIGSKERNTLLKLIIGMAKDAYGFDPTASRSPFPKELEGILDGLGISVSDDTIRKWLKEAADYLPPDNDTN